jgi:hypothetical protein
MDLGGLTQTVAEGKFDRLELKKSTGELKAGMRTLCALLNGSGGRVLFGVTPCGRILGQDVTDPTFQEVAVEVRRLEPPADIAQTRVPLPPADEGLGRSGGLYSRVKNSVAIAWNSVASFHAIRLLMGSQEVQVSLWR